MTRAYTWTAGLAPLPSAAEMARGLRALVGAVATTGWRPAFGWLGALVAFYSYIYAPGHAIAVDYGAVNVFLGFILGMYLSRGAEKTAGALAGLPVGARGPGAEAGHA